MTALILLSINTLQREYKITITGPTTVSAFLSSLQMGFRSLAVEKRTSKIGELLGAIRTEFGKFGDVLEKTKEKLKSANKKIDRAGTRSRVIERRLRDVQTLPDHSVAAPLFTALAGQPGMLDFDDSGAADND